MPVFKTGAFLQQCFAVHPLSLSVKVVLPPDKIGVLCTQCNIRHRLTGKTFSTGSEALASEVVPNHFTRCVTDHPEELRIGSVDIHREIIQFRCKACQRQYRVDVAVWETHQP